MLKYKNETIVSSLVKEQKDMTLKVMIGSIHFCTIIRANHPCVLG